MAESQKNKKKQQLKENNNLSMKSVDFCKSQTIFNYVRCLARHWLLLLLLHFVITASHFLCKYQQQKKKHAQ